jgi:hypothetical protein
MRKLKLSRCVTNVVFTVWVTALTPPSFSQGTGASPELQQKIAVIRQSVEDNKAALRQYTWTETMQTLLKGDVKSTKVSQCQYGPDGTVQKTPIGGTAPASTPRGLRGRVVQKKKDEIQSYMERVASLIQRYTPPSGSEMQASLQAGNASIEPSESGVVTATFNNYALQGDAVTLMFDAATKRILSYNVNTYLDSPSDVVTLKVVFDNLPGGPNYVSQSVLDATAEQVQIRTTSTGYTKIM